MNKHVQEVLCTGNSARTRTYAHMVDQTRLVAFLREQGLSEKALTSLSIHFTYALPYERKAKKKQALGSSKLWKNEITLCIHEYPGKLASYTQQGQQEILEEINETLLHEICHLLDRHSWWIGASLGIKLLCTLVIPLLLISLVLLPLHVPGVLASLAGIPLALGGGKLAYRIDPMEIRARAFEGKYTQVLLLSQPRTRTPKRRNPDRQEEEITEEFSPHS